MSAYPMSEERTAVEFDPFTIEIIQRGDLGFYGKSQYINVGFMQ